MRKIWLVLIGMLLCTSVYANNLATGIVIGSAMSNESPKIVSDGTLTEARVYSCGIWASDINDDEDTRAKIATCAKRLQRICPTCVLGRLHSVVETNNHVDVRFEIVDTAAGATK